MPLNDVHMNKGVLVYTHLILFQFRIHYFQFSRTIYFELKTQLDCDFTLL